MQIAIVDDRAEDREELSVCLENYMKKHQLDYTLTEFEDGENFLKSCRRGQFSACLYGHLYGEHGWNRDRQKAAPEKTGFVRSFF